jgi:hypothetical protein
MIRNKFLSCWLSLLSCFVLVCTKLSRRLIRYYIEHGIVGMYYLSRIAGHRHRHSGISIRHGTGAFLYSTVGSPFYGISVVPASAFSSFHYRTDRTPDSPAFKKRTVRRCKGTRLALLTLDWNKMNLKFPSGKVEGDSPGMS